MLRACTGSAIVLVVPGAVVALLLHLRLRSLATWAAIPAFSLATVFVIAEVLDLVGLPFNVLTVSVVVIFLGGVAFARLRESRATDLLGVPTFSRAGTADEALARRIALGMLLLAIAVGL